MANMRICHDLDEAGASPKEKRCSMSDTGRQYDKSDGKRANVCDRLRLCAISQTSTHAEGQQGLSSQ
eukprot:CAMPEP_0183443522 /NCGR_PEP_ID=MMETSP0370-20130417/92074_1 /TAXON_ID=268820 /ORGANISM="Peridinium aciculiferum, Strain PAER-2" /LENGTH=66 /DNA_ID=CAMNT_0025633555 /DNA_START=40 /DNA_END=237 /DNA_ORIENTATION=-